MKKQEAGQSNAAIRKNADFFAGNDRYKSNQSRLETYRLIAESAADEVKTANHILDIGNGGIFIFSDRPHSSSRSNRSFRRQVFLCPAP